MGRLRTQIKTLRESSLLDGAEFNPGRREVRCVMITEGPGNLRDRNYYTPEFIQEAAQAYNGAKSYLNHQTAPERATRPEGDIRTLAGYWKDVVAGTVETTGGLTVAALWGTLSCDTSEAGSEAYAKAQAQIEYSEIFKDNGGEYCGLSINGSGRKDGTVMIGGQPWTKIVGVGEADSVDVVTQPARGGAFIALMESAAGARNLEDMDMDAKERIKLMSRLIEAKDKKDTAEAARLTKLLNEGRGGKKAGKEDEGEAEAPVPGSVAGCEACEASPAGICGKHLNAYEAEQAGGESEGEEESSHEGEDEGEAEGEVESEGAPAAAPDADGDSTGAPVLDAIKKLVPQGEGEDEAAYNQRLLQVHALAKPKAGAESRAPRSADDLRKNFPRLFEAVAARVREASGKKADDLKAVKAELREAKVKLLLLESQSAAKRLLAEAKLPSGVLRADDLIGMTESEMKREIERVQSLVKAVTAESRRGNPGQAVPGAGRGGASASDMDPELRESVDRIRRKIKGE